MCGPGIDTQARMERTGYDPSDRDLRGPLHALVLVLEAATKQMPRVDDPFATGLVVTHRADGTVEARGLSEPPDSFPFTVECAPPASALAVIPSP